MLRYPASVPSQQEILAPLTSLLSQVPALETWITFLASAQAVYDTLSAGALGNLASIALSVANVCDALYTATTQSIYSSQYLLHLSSSARAVSANATLSAQASTGGSVGLTLTQGAQTALTSLTAWDPVQQTSVPSNPVQLLNTLMGGVTVR